MQISSGTTFWLMKEPEEFINHVCTKFKDGTIDDHHKYLHREEGPAIEYTYSCDEWWWYGELLINVNSQEEFELWKRFKNFE